jgi:hypothetical protein
MDGVPSFDWTRHTEPEGSTDLSMMVMNADDAEVPHLPLFNLNLDDLPASSDAGGWSDSDDDDATLRDGRYADGEQVEGEGEYTGKWRMLTVRTKLDPPSSATRERMEEWGRPITPFPKRIAKLDLLEEEEHMFKHREEATDDEEEKEVREMSIPLDDEEQDAAKDLGPRPFDFDVSFEDIHELPTPEVVPQEEPQDTLLDASFDQHGDNPATKLHPEIYADSEDDQEEREVRQMSVEFEDGEDENESASIPPLQPVLSLAAPAVDESMEDPGVISQELGAFAAAEEAADGDSSDEVESDFEDVGLVKITSTDPKAAARAAAILKQVRLNSFICTFLIFLIA